MKLILSYTEFVQVIEKLEALSDDSAFVYQIKDAKGRPSKYVAEFISGIVIEGKPSSMTGFQREPNRSLKYGRPFDFRKLLVGC